MWSALHDSGPAVFTLLSLIFVPLTWMKRRAIHDFWTEELQ